MATEPDPGRQGRRRSTGTGTDVTAAFKVDDTSLRKLNDLWGQLVKNVKAFNAELGKINARSIDAATAATSRLHGAMGGGGSSGRPSTITAGGFSNPPGQGWRHTTYQGPPQPGAAAPTAVAGTSASAGNGGTVKFSTASKFVGGTILAAGAYGGSHKQNMIDAERLAQYTAWGTPGNSETMNNTIRDTWFGANGRPGMTGGQNTQDYLRGIATMQANIGYGFGKTQQEMYQGAGRIGNLLGSYEQGARVQSSLASTGTFYGLMSLGIQTVGVGGTHVPAEKIARQFLMRVYRGRMPTEEEVASGMRQGMPLRASMDAYQLDPETQEWIAKYGMLSGKIARMGGDASLGGMISELGVTGGKTPIGKSAIGATAYDASRQLGQAQTKIEQEIADTALPVMREAFESMAWTLNKVVNPALDTFAGKLFSATAGAGASMGGAASAVGGFAGGLIPSLLIAHALRGGAGPGGLLGRGLRAVTGGGAAKFLKVGGLATAGTVGGAVASHAVGGGTFGGTLQGAATGAGIGAGLGMLGGPFAPLTMGAGAGIGAALGGGIGLARGLFEGRGGPGQDTFSSEEIDTVMAALSAQATAPGGARSGGTSAASSTSGSPSVPGGGSGAGATSRGAAALAWMMAQSRRPSQSWKNWCLRAVRSAFGVEGKYNDATEAWGHTRKRHGGTPPPGVPVWWTGGQGHVALSAGGGFVWSNDILRDGQIDKVPIDMITRKWNKPYQGWSEDINDVDVYNPGTSVGGGAAGGKSSTGKARTGKLGASDVFKYARDAGFDRAAAIMMTAIAGGESGFNAGSLNPDASTGDLSYGLWQINMLGALGPERRKMLGINDNSALYDPRTNAHAAWLISNRGHTYMPWSAYKNGSYRRYLSAAQSAASSLPNYRVGAWDIDSDQVAMVHQGEMVLPAKQANRVRNAAQRGTGNRVVHVQLNMPIHMASGVSTAEVEKLVHALTRRFETDQRLAAVMAGD